MGAAWGAGDGRAVLCGYRSHSCASPVWLHRRAWGRWKTSMVGRRRCKLDPGGLISKRPWFQNFNLMKIQNYTFNSNPGLCELACHPYSTGTEGRWWRRGRGYLCTA